MLKEIKIKIGVVAVIKKNNKYLIAKRKKNDYLGGQWEFPGGKIKKGESKKNCLKRELKEELGIDAKIGKFITDSFFSHQNSAIHLFAYQVNDFSGKIILKEHDDFKWINKKEFSDFDFVEVDLSIIKKIL